MSATATTDEIRRAYRALARRHHPDAAGASSAAEMAAVNEAWRVLSDPARRAVYDASLRATPPAPGPSASPSTPPEIELDDDTGFQPLRHPSARFGIPLPWILVIGALAVIFVFTAYAVRPKGSPDRIDGVIEVGSCVSVPSPGVVVETRCSGPNDGRVVALPARGLYCDDGAAAYADDARSRVVCVRGG